MCLGAYGTVVELLGDARAAVRFGDGTVRDVSLAVLVAEGTPVTPGDVVAVSIGMALHRLDRDGTEWSDEDLNDMGRDTADDEEVARW